MPITRSTVRPSSDGDRLERAVGLVEPPILEAPHVVVEPLLDARPQKHFAGRGAQLAQELLARDERVALDGDLPDDGAWPGIDGERQQRPVRGRAEPAVDASTFARR